jgi:hypothetical protein
MDGAGFGTSACDKRLFDLDPISCGWRYSILVAWVALPPISECPYY